MEKRISDNTRDEQHFNALLELINIKALEYPKSLAGIRPLVRQLNELGQELGHPYDIAALTGNQSMYAIVCPRLEPVQRDSGAMYFFRIRELIGQPTTPQEAEILMTAHLNMFPYCVGEWHKNDSLFWAIEEATKIPMLSDSALMVANMYYLVKLHMKDGGTQRGNEVIQENLRLAEKIEGAYEVKYRFHTLMADFQSQFTGDQERVLELYKKAGTALKNMPEATRITRVDNLQWQTESYTELEDYDSALVLLDSISTLLSGMIKEEDTEAIDAYLSTLSNYLNVFTKEEKAGGAQFIEAGEALISKHDKDLYDPFKALFRGRAGVYLFQQGQKQQAATYLRPFLEQAPSFIYRVEMRMLYAKALESQASIDEEAGDFESSTKLYRQAMEVEQELRRIDVDRGTAQAAFSLDVAENDLAREQAELAVQVERQTSSARSRLFWLALFAAGLILAILTWAYLRSRRDQRLIAQQNQVVNQSLSEKEVLLREIHHRVKNNLQIISSLLQSQADIVDNEEVSQLVAEGQERIHSMALIHQNLYQSENLEGVNIKNYLGDLTENIQRSHAGVVSPIGLNLIVADEHLDIDTAIPVGLILNELITNAYKYAFPDGKAGSISVEFGKVAERFHLKVSDNGVGLPTDHDLRKSNSLGINLVNGLVRQLEGKIAWAQQNPGTTVAIEF